MVNVTVTINTINIIYMYCIICPHKGPTTINMQVKSQTLAYYITYIMYIFILPFTCIVHISPPSLIFACHGIYVINIIYIYLTLVHIGTVKTSLYLDLHNPIFLTNRNSSHCISYVAYSNLTSHFDNG